MFLSFSLSMCAVVCACVPVLSPEDDIGGCISHGLPIPLRKILSLNLRLVFFFGWAGSSCQLGSRVWMPGFLKMVLGPELQSTVTGWLLFLAEVLSPPLHYFP